MKGQFFVIATVIMIYTLVLVVQYIYDFANINLTQLEEMGELYYIQYIKETLNSTVNNSFNSGGCDRLDSDIKATKKFLEEEMIKKGVNLTINYQIQSCPNTSFSFSLKTSNLFTKTEFTYIPAPLFACDYYIHQTDIPYTITESNKYYCLAEDILDSEISPCINISANYVTLDCQGHTIDGVYYVTDYGIYVYRSSLTTTNITIRNCLVTDWTDGIYLYRANNNTLINNTANSNSEGIYLESAYYNQITNNTVNSNEYDGIFFYSSSSNIISNNIANSNANGIYLWTSSDNQISNNIANSNGYGIYFWTRSLFNILTNNTVNSNSYGVYFSTNSYSNILTNNTVNSNSYGVLLYSSPDNNLTGGSIANTVYDYLLSSAGTNNNFTNTNFTAARKIRFSDTTSWFNYRNDTASNIWLKTNVSSAATITRKLISWSQILMQWNDTNSTGTGITTGYNITGLKVSTIYNVYNNSVLTYTLQTDALGNLPSFTIYLPAEREIKVQG